MAWSGRKPCSWLAADFGLVNYTADEQIAISLPLAIITNDPFYYSDDRDNRSYIGYLGFQHAFLPNLSLNAQGGFQYTDSYNDPLSSPSLSSLCGHVGGLHLCSRAAMRRLVSRNRRMQRTWLRRTPRGGLRRASKVPRFTLPSTTN